MPDMLNTAISGLLSAQRALSTTSHNIANVNTTGYSRQSVEFETNAATNLGGSFFGNGVSIASVSRAYDQFLTQEVRDTTSVHARLSQFSTLAGYIDDVLADPQGGISPILHDFFSAIQGVADDPASSTARFALISTAESFAERFHNIDMRFEQLSTNTLNDIRDVVTEINALVVSIRDVNIALNEVGAFVAGSQQSNDLLDQRDNLITKLSEKVEISVVQGSENNISIFIGNGQSMLTGNTASLLEVKPNPDNPAADVITYNGQISVFDLSPQLNGGELGGLLDFKKNILTPTQNALGRTAIGVAEAVNQQMGKGMDLNGNLGQNLFSYESPKVLSSSRNTGTATVSVNIDDISALTTDDYTLAFDGTDWTLTSDTGASTTIASANPTNLSFEGLTLTINDATAAAGDKFIIKPTISGAGSIKVIIADSNLIAAAAPIRTSAPLSNLGGASISAGAVIDSTHANLLDTVYLSFASATSLTADATVVVGATTYLAGAIIPYSSGMVVNANGWQASLDGIPKAGDQLIVESNVGGTGDNRNALSLANLQNIPLLNGATASFQEDYGTLVGFVGSQTLAAKVSEEAQKSLLTQAISRNSSSVGVSLDEEAADLIKFQQAYEATARIISTVQTMFDTIIQSTR